jgi:hypothetical protein
VPRRVAPAADAPILEHVLFALKHEALQLALQQSLIDETFFLQAYDQAFERIDKEFDLPNRTINLAHPVDPAEPGPHAGAAQERGGTHPVEAGAGRAHRVHRGRVLPP